MSENKSESKEEKSTKSKTARKYTTSINGQVITVEAKNATEAGEKARKIAKEKK